MGQLLDSCIAPEESLKQLPEFTPQIRYIQLLIWGGKLAEAANMLEKSIVDNMIRGTKHSGVIPLSYIDLLVSLYVLAGEDEQALKAYTWGGELAENNGFTTLSALFSTNRTLLQDALRAGSPARPDFAHWFAWRRAYDRQCEPNTVAIVANYPEIPNCTLLVDELMAIGIKSRVVYSENFSAQEQGRDFAGIILVGGPFASGIQENARILFSQTDFDQMLYVVGWYETGGIVKSSSSAQNVIWIGGRYPWSITLLVESWIKEGGCQAFGKCLLADNSFPEC